MQDYEILYEGEEEPQQFLVKDGIATATFPNGDTYSGEYKEAKRNGKGTYTYSKGGKYTGDWVDGEVSECSGEGYPRSRVSVLFTYDTSREEED